ncbi:fungal specific transcription factor domain-containing protein [Aspergillus lucknowensis]|uniref:Uncharacterized protein n=1 Tax=Aspergillus lucknowensis TaxID=176173 RepID=A0ABR4M012_9EURO
MTGKTLDLLYNGNLGSQERVLNYELTSRVLRLRYQLEEWVPTLPAHMSLVSGTDLASRLVGGRDLDDPAINRFRIGHDSLALDDISQGTVRLSIDSATHIIGIVRTAVNAGQARRGLFASWRFTLIDAALVIFTIFLLSKQSNLVGAWPLISSEALKETFHTCIESLQRLDKGNGTVDKRCQCLQMLAELWNVIESSERDNLNQLDSPVNQETVFGDLNFMADKQFDVTDGFLSSWG